MEKHKATILGGASSPPPEANIVDANIKYSPRFKVTADVDVADPTESNLSEIIAALTDDDKAL